MSHLTIRNLTSTPTELKLIERYEAPTVEERIEGGLANLTNLTRRFSFRLGNACSNAPSLSAYQLASHTESFSHEDVSVPIEPFETKVTEIKATEKDLKHITRLTFETEGQRYRLDTPVPSDRSVVLTALSPNPKFQYTAVYVPKLACLALYSSASLESWMSQLKNESPLSALSIPGTHNSPTYHIALPSVRCQAVSVRDQLANGVRFLDIRVQPESPDDPSKDCLILVHSAFPVSLTGNKYFRRDLLHDIDAFLTKNPSETIIMSLKREGVGKATDEQLCTILHTHYTSAHPERWFTEPRIPTLGEARGKIVLIRRFHVTPDLKDFGINASSWPDNCADGTCSSGEIRVQDFYEISESENIAKKIALAESQLARAAECVCVLPQTSEEAAHLNAPPKPQMPFFINFLSASNFWSAKCWPDRIAAKVNPHIVEFLCTKHNVKEGKACGDGGTGIVVCDWVGYNGDWDLVRCIVGMNAKLELREKEAK